jgi:hypothetical protein
MKDKYKVTRLEDNNGKISYRIESMEDSFIFKFVSFNYKEIEEEVSKLNVGEHYIIEV